MSRPSDSELDRALHEGRPLVPAGFADAVLRRAAEGTPVDVPRPPRSRAVLGFVAGTVVAAAVLLLVLRPENPPAPKTAAVVAGAGTLAPAPGAALVVDEKNELHLLRGRARLDGRAVVHTPRARVVGTTSDARVDLEVAVSPSLETQEPDMIGMKTATALAAAAAGTILSVVVVRGSADVEPMTPPAPVVTLAAGKRMTVGEPAASPSRDRAPVASSDVASREVAMRSAGAIEPPSEAECPGVAPEGDCAGGPCPDCNHNEQPEPASPERVQIPIEGSPSMGPAGARVTIVEFTEYQCPFCERAMSNVHLLPDLYPGKVRIVLKNFPLPGHKNARLAAEAALAAGEQGKYWEMHDLLFANRDALDRAALESYAKQLGLDLDRFRTGLDDGRFSAQVGRDIDDGTAAGIEGVPTFFINGLRVIGAVPLEQLKKIVDEELAK